MPYVPEMGNCRKSEGRSTGKAITSEKEDMPPDSSPNSPDKRKEGLELERRGEVGMTEEFPGKSR